MGHFGFTIGLFIYLFYMGYLFGLVYSWRETTNTFEEDHFLVIDIYIFLGYVRNTNKTLCWASLPNILKNGLQQWHRARSPIHTKAWSGEFGQSGSNSTYLGLGQKLIVIIKHVQIAKATSLLPNIFGVWGWGGFGLLVTTI